MQTGFDKAFRRVKELVADFRATEIVVSSLWLEYIGIQRQRSTHRCDRLAPFLSLVRVIDFQPLAFSLQHCFFGALTPAEIQIVEVRSRNQRHRNRQDPFRHRR